MSQFPWEVTRENLIQFFKGPYLFSALYRLFRGAYYGQGFQVCEKNVELSSRFQDRFNQLPLEIKAQILFKNWEQGKLYKTIFIRKEELCLPNKLLFLLGQYDRHKRITQPLLSTRCRVWNGHLVEKHLYSFEFGTPNLRDKLLILDFLSREPYHTFSPCFGFLCP